MSTEGLDEETKRILAEVEADDSKPEIKKDEKEQPDVKDKVIIYETDDHGQKWETNTKETDDSEW